MKKTKSDAISKASTASKKEKPTKSAAAEKGKKNRFSKSRLFYTESLN